MVSRVVPAISKQWRVLFNKHSTVSISPIGFSHNGWNSVFDHVSYRKGIDKSLEDKFDSVQQFVELGSVRKFHIFLCKVEFEFDKENSKVLRVIWLSR
jgi:hypothetical protein